MYKTYYFWFVFRVKPICVLAFVPYKAVSWVSICKFLLETCNRQFVRLKEHERNMKFNSKRFICANWHIKWANFIFQECRKIICAYSYSSIIICADFASSIGRNTVSLPLAHHKEAEEGRRARLFCWTHAQVI